MSGNAQRVVKGHGPYSDPKVGEVLMYLAKNIDTLFENDMKIASAVDEVLDDLVDQLNFHKRKR